MSAIAKENTIARESGGVGDVRAGSKTSTTPIYT